MYFTYVLYNQLKNKIYIGQTANVESRLRRHNQELPYKSTSFTYKNKGKWELIYKEGFKSRQEAIKREKELKSYKGREFIKNTIIFGAVAQG